MPGDLNARVGNEGCNGVPGRNVSVGIVIGNAYFSKKGINKFTWQM